MGIGINPERTLQVFLILGFVLHVSCGLSLAQASPPDRSLSSNDNVAASNNDSTVTKEVLAMINRPATITDLLQNIKFALEHDLLLQKDFYTDENLKRFFRTSKIEWTTNEPASKLGTLVAFDDLPYKDQNERPYNVDVKLGLWDYGKKQPIEGGGITLTGRYPVEIVEKVFGTKMEVTNPYAGDSLEHPTLLQETTHKYGNKGLIYRFNTVLAKKAFAAFVMNGDGTVNRLNATEEGK